jgi:hypothetical protein
LWLSRRLISDLGWLQWLFGAPAPSGAFVVGLEVQRLRKEMSCKGVLRAVGVNPATLWHWKRSPRTSAPTKAILAGENCKQTTQWAQLPSDTQIRMEKIRKALSLRECCNRAEMSVSGYHNLVKKAERCGVRHEFEQYLKLRGKYVVNRSRQCGLVADRFFIPTPDMLRFRDEAVQEGTKQKIWSLADLPGFKSWFMAWVTPKAHRGRRQVIAPEGTVAQVPGALNGTKSKGGRPPEDQTQAIHKFCHDKYVSEDKGAATVMVLANRKFGAETIKESSTVRLYARRYAQKHGLPLKGRGI